MRRSRSLQELTTLVLSKVGAILVTSVLVPGFVLGTVQSTLFALIVLAIFSAIAQRILPAMLYARLTTATNWAAGIR
jgi:hypothetical protein